MDKLSRERCQFISDLPEIERKWSRLLSEGHLRKVGLLTTKAVELVDALLELGMVTMVNGLVIYAVFVFQLILSPYVFLRYGQFQAVARSSSSPQILGKALQAICSCSGSSCLRTFSNS